MGKFLRIINGIPRSVEESSGSGTGISETDYIASGFGDGTGEIGCTITQASNKTDVAITSWTFTVGKNSGSVFGDIDVGVNGQQIERKVAGINDIVGNIIFEEKVDGTGVTIYEVTSGGTEVLSNDASIVVFKTGLSLAEVASNCIPSVDETYDLGSSSKKWKDLYLKGTSIHLGSAVISRDASTGELKYSRDGVETAFDLNINKQNLIINGAFDFWQRGTTISNANGTYTADRWNARSTTPSNQFSRQTGDSDSYLPYYMQALAIGSSENYLQLAQQIEFKDFAHLRGKTVTLSVKIRPQNLSAACTAFGATYYYLTSEDTNCQYGANSASGAAIFSSTLVGGYQVVKGSFTIPSNAKSLSIQLGSPSTSNTFGHGDGWSIAWVSLNEGNYSSVFKRAGDSIAGELTLCQRYYEKSYNLDMTPGTSGHSYLIFVTGGSYGFACINYRATKRTIAPTITIYAGDGTSGYVTRSSDNTKMAVSVSSTGDSSCQIRAASLDGSSINSYYYAYSISAEF